MRSAAAVHAALTRTERPVAGGRHKRSLLLIGEAVEEGGKGRLNGFEGGKLGLFELDPGVETGREVRRRRDFAFGGRGRAEVFERRSKRLGSGERIGP